MQGSIEHYACFVPASPGRAPTVTKRRVKVIYVRVDATVAEGIAKAAEACGVSLARAWERAGERYLIEHFGRPEKAAPSLP